MGKLNLSLDTVYTIESKDEPTNTIDTTNR